jgi:hypothetical protein
VEAFGADRASAGRCAAAFWGETRAREVIETGTPSQIEWAEQIRPRVAAEFDRVAETLAVVAGNQGGEARADTLEVIAIVKEKKAETMAHTFAGYYIRDWQELTDQVRRMIAGDPRFGAIQARREARRHAARTPRAADSTEKTI